LSLSEWKRCVGMSRLLLRNIRQTGGTQNTASLKIIKDLFPTRVNILWLKTGPLHPLDTGGKIRTYNMLREFMCCHRVTYLSLCPDETGGEVKKRASEYSHTQEWIPWRETPKGTLQFYLELVGNLVASSQPYVSGNTGPME